MDGWGLGQMVPVNSETFLIGLVFNADNLIMKLQSCLNVSGRDIPLTCLSIGRLVAVAALLHKRSRGIVIGDILQIAALLRQDVVSSLVAFVTN